MRQNADVLYGMNDVWSDGFGTAIDIRPNCLVERAFCYVVVVVVVRLKVLLLLALAMLCLMTSGMSSPGRHMQVPT